MFYDKRLGVFYGGLIGLRYKKGDISTDCPLFLLYLSQIRFLFMKEFVISEAKVETAVLVGLITQTQDERKTTEYLDELEFLAHTAGATVVRRFTQKLPCAH